MAQQAAPIPVPIKIDYGHTETQVVMIFSQDIRQNFMTIEQAEAMISSLRVVVDGLKKHLATHPSTFTAGKPS